MCDTIGRRIGEGHSIFAKNSDRSPNEPQIIEFIEHKKHTEDTLKCTYISIDQVEETNAMVISRPVWLWGAEMGVNEHGVCIGNEAVFTKGKYGEDSLIGMDYVRLGLERGNTAYEAVRVITELLEKHGQGGNCGYDKNFRYDNSYLIMDRQEIYVLETAGREWAYKKYEHASISNRLTLGDDCDAYSGEPCDFAKKHSDFLYSTFSAAANRRKMTCSSRLDSIYDAFAALRQHTVKDPMCRASVSSVCMHAGDMFADQTTSSMVVDLTDEIKIYVTGSSRPCMSIFKPHDFCAGGVIRPENAKNADEYWKRVELRQRGLLGMIVPDVFYAKKDALERHIISDPDADFFALERAFYDNFEVLPFEEGNPSGSFMRYWEKKNGKLMQGRGDR
ncbi:MAG: hypothetical protein IJH92_06750 [Mogibacterium sp.]|nr:hypothetical protein [Mogibacterium sp.]